MSVCGDATRPSRLRWLLQPGEGEQTCYWAWRSRSGGATPKQIVVDFGPLARPDSSRYASSPTHTFSEVPGGAPCKGNARGSNQGSGVP